MSWLTAAVHLRPKLDELKALLTTISARLGGSGSIAVTSTQLPAALGANGALKVEGVAGGTAQPVSVASLPLPTGAATQATLASLLAVQGEVLQTDTFTATGSGFTMILAGYAAKYYTLSVFPTGAVTSWDVRMEVSIDGLGWVEVAQHTNVTPGASIPAFSSTPKLARAARARCAGLVLGGGTNVIASIVASR